MVFTENVLMSIIEKSNGPADRNRTCIGALGVLSTIHCTTRPESFYDLMSKILKVGAEYFYSDGQ